MQLQVFSEEDTEKSFYKIVVDKLICNFYSYNYGAGH